MIPDFKKEEEQVKKLYEATFDVVGEIGLEIVDESFEKEQFQDGKSAKWAPRKNDKEAGKARIKRRALLVKSGDLKRSVDYETRPAQGEVAIGSDSKYAEIHNEGGEVKKAARSELFQRKRYKSGKKKGKFRKGTTAGKGMTFKESTSSMPQRQFMGPSPEMDKRVGDYLDSEMDKIFG